MIHDADVAEMLEATDETSATAVYSADTRETLNVTDTTQTQADRAYSLWEADGKPFGRDDYYWSQAE